MFGILIFNGDRPDIVFEDGTLYGGLHCGECFQYYYKDNLLDVRLEYEGGWLLVYGQQIQSIQYGTRVKI